MQTVPLLCRNLKAEVQVPYGMTLLDFIKKEDIKSENVFLGALVNNKVRDLTYQIHKPAVIEFFDYYSTYGHNMYVRSLYFLLCKTVHDLFPLKVKLHIKHSISGGRFCRLEQMDEPITEELVKRMKHHMMGLVERDIPFERVGMLTPDAIRTFQEYGLEDKYELFKDRDRIYTSVYKLENTVNYYYGFMVPSTGYLKMFGLEEYEDGILLKIPSSKNINVLPKTRRMPKLFSVYKENKQWAEELGIPHVSDLNRLIDDDKVQDMILVAEAFQEKRIAAVADNIFNRGGVKMVLISEIGRAHV